MDKIDACLNCSLPICDDRDKRCAFVKITRHDKSVVTGYSERIRQRKLARKKRRNEQIKRDIVAILKSLRSEI